MGIATQVLPGYSIDPAVWDDGDDNYYMYFGGLWGGQLQRYRNNKALESAILPEGEEEAIPSRVARLVEHDGVCRRTPCKGPPSPTNCL